MASTHVEEIAGTVEAATDIGGIDAKLLFG